MGFHVNICFYYLGEYSEVELLESMVTLFNFLKEFPNCFSMSVQHFTFSLAIYECSNFSVSLIILVIIFFVIVVLVGMEWYFIVAIICISLMVNKVEHLLMFSGHLYIFSGEMFI